MDSLFFYPFAALILAGAVFTVSLRNPVHCAISLLVSLSGVAGLFLAERADFLFAAQLIVYAGGVILLFLFVIMLINLDRTQSQRRFTRWWALGLAAAFIIGFLLVPRNGLALPPMIGEMPALNTEAVADLLLSQYLLPFEAVSILLLAALVGGAVLARGKA